MENKRLPTVVSETSQWLAVDKPAGWLSIAGRSTLDKNASGSGPPVLVDWLRKKYSDVFTVHRLDRETSGIMLFARTASDHRLANSWFQKRMVKKTYECLASGRISAPVLKINDLVEGVAAVTQVEVRFAYQQGFLARVIPVTGRRHQIRVHLANRGFPLWGDREYRGQTQIILNGRILDIPRVALHSCRIALPDGNIFVSQWPEDFKYWAQRLEEDGYPI